MKPTRLLIALIFPLLLATTLPATSQVLGIFQQGAQDLKEYGQQIAALELLFTRQRTGYQILQSGLANISTIANNEFTLHQTYYAGLFTVNPSIAQLPQINDILSLQSSMLQNLKQAENRWQNSINLTTSDQTYIYRFISILMNATSNMFSALSKVLSDNLAIPDNNRIEIILQLCDEMKSYIALYITFCAEVDLVLAYRNVSGS